MSKTSKTTKKTAAAAPRLGRGRRPQTRKLRDARDALYREHIMEIAEKIFADQGYANTKMQDIAAAAGISLATLYQSYPGKQELHRGLLIERNRQMLNLVLVKRRVELRTVLSVEQILLFMEAHLHFLLDHPDYLRMQLQEGHAWYHRAAQPTGAEQEMWERGMEVLEQVFSAGMQLGLFSPGHAGNQARVLMTLQQTRLANWVIAGMSEAGAAVISRIQADFVRMFCRPELVKKLLTPDGAGLNQKTLKHIRSLDAEQPAKATGG